jgi:hypothetical protein
MNIIYIFTVLILFLVLLFGIINPGCSQKKDNANKTSAMDTVKHFLTKEEIAAKLISLAKSSPPTKLSEGAMCYKVAGPPRRAEYICPTCGAKTIYTDNEAYWINRELPTCRATIKTIKCLDIKLNESQFCKKCSPKTEDPSIGIILKYKGDQKKQILWGISKTDLDLLAEFCQGKNIHSDNNDFESPLKNYLKRLQELLKIKVNVE